MQQLPAALLTALFEATHDQLAKYFCAFNGWEFPEELSKYKPEWWGKEQEPKSAFMKPIMRYIKDTIGIKACNREWNRETMSDEEHEMWWRSRYLNPEGTI